MSQQAVFDSSWFRKHATEYLGNLKVVLESISIEELQVLAECLYCARTNRRQIFILGNGGSAANASHIVNDLTKVHFSDDKLLFRAICLNDSMPRITATANDQGYDRIFVDQLRALLEPGDLVVAISSSGNSPNVIKAVEWSSAHGAITFGIVGFDGGALQKVASKSLYLKTRTGDYGLMEDATLIVGHLISTFFYQLDAEMGATKE